MSELESTHLDSNQLPHMVDVGEKQVTQRIATAIAKIACPEELIEQLESDGNNHKGPILHTCVLAAISAIKKTSDIIPLCHPLPLSGIDVEPELNKESLELHFKVSVKTDGKTGVEMEALHGASVAALCFYDMVKGQYRSLTISSIQLLEKSGGKSGHYVRKQE